MRCKVCALAPVMSYLNREPIGCLLKLMEFSGNGLVGLYLVLALFFSLRLKK